MEKTPYVGPFLRIIASVYDFFLLLGVWFLVGSLALWLNGGEILNPVLGSLLVFLSGWTFYAFFWMKNGQTLGMQAWKIKLVADDNQAISIKSMLLRLVLGLLFGSIAGLNFFVILFRSDKRSLNDIFSKTKIVRS